jgi:anthranilate phosphoribosyltransferase
LNAGAACYVAGLAPDLRGGARLAAEAIDSGEANDVLVRFVATSQRIGAAEAAAV